MNNKPKKLKEIQSDIVVLKNGKRVKFEYQQNIYEFNKCFVVNKVVATTVDEVENKEIGSLKIGYIDKERHNKISSGDHGDIYYAAMYGNLSSHDFFDDNGNKNKLKLDAETVKRISWYILSDKNYSKANEHSNMIDKMNTNQEFLNYLSEIKMDIAESVKYLKKRREILLVDKPYIDYIKVSDKIDGYRNQGLAIEMYTRAAQWVGLNKMTLKAGLLNDNSAPIWDLKLSKMDEFNYKEEKIKVKKNKYESEELTLRTIVRYDGKPKQKKVRKLKT